MWSTVILALTTAGSSAVIIKILEHFLNKKSTNANVELGYRAQFVKESEAFRIQIEELKKEIKTIELSVDEWRTKYWELMKQYNDFRYKASLIFVKHNIEFENE